jgi:hypothetical protein
MDATNGTKWELSGAICQTTREQGAKSNQNTKTNMG